MKCFETREASDVSFISDGPCLSAMHSTPGTQFRVAFHAGAGWYTPDDYNSKRQDEHLNKIDKFEKMKGNYHASEKCYDVSRAIHLLLEWYLPIMCLFLKEKVISEMYYQWLRALPLPFNHCTFLIWEYPGSWKLFNELSVTWAVATKDTTGSTFQQVVSRQKWQLIRACNSYLHFTKKISKQVGGVCTFPKVMYLVSIGAV